MAFVRIDSEEYEEMIEQYRDMEKENGRLIDDNNKMDDEIDRLRNEISQLKQALSKCSPFTACNGKQNNVCEFCFEKEHLENCEYLKLCGGVE